MTLHLINTATLPAHSQPKPSRRRRRHTPHLRKHTWKALAGRSPSLPPTIATPPPTPPPKPKLILDFRAALAATPLLAPKPPQLGHEVKVFFGPHATAYTTAWSRVLTRDAGQLVRAHQLQLPRTGTSTSTSTSTNASTETGAGVQIQPFPSALRLPDVSPGDFGAWQAWVADKEGVEERDGLGCRERWEWVEEMARAWLFGARYGMREFQDAVMRCLRREGRRLRGTRAAEAVAAAAGVGECRSVVCGPLGEKLLEEVWARTERLAGLRLFLVYLAAECCFPAEAPTTWFAGLLMVDGFWGEWDMGLELFCADVEERREYGVSEWDYDELDARTKRDFYVKEAVDEEAKAFGWNESAEFGWEGSCMER